jgi:hypothetical protein
VVHSSSSKKNDGGAVLLGHNKSNCGRSSRSSSVFFRKTCCCGSGGGCGRCVPSCSSRIGAKLHRAILLLLAAALLLMYHQNNNDDGRGGTLRHSTKNPQQLHRSSSSSSSYPNLGRTRRGKDDHSSSSSKKGIETNREGDLAPRDEPLLKNPFPPSVSIGARPIQASHFSDGGLGVSDDRGRPKYKFLDTHLDLTFFDGVQQPFGRRIRDYWTVDQPAWDETVEAALEAMDHSLDDYYYRFDERDYPRPCALPDWTDWQFPNCQTFHEEALLDRPLFRYLAHGYYRDTYLHDDTNSDNTPDSDGGSSGSGAYVLKRLRYKDHLDFSIKKMSQIRTEALVMERLSASDRTTNIYGYCSTSIFVEVARDITLDIVPYIPDYGQEERGRISQDRLDVLYEAHDGRVSLNNYTALQRLEIATAVAEGIAEMHGYERSVIVNDDVHPDQWLRTPDGRVILNDMNNAVFLEVDLEHDRQSYCTYYSSYGGDFRAPEEYVGDYVDETVDVRDFSFEPLF